MLKLISTVEMVADMGTKALDQKKFVFFRDVMNGYALARASTTTATRSLPAMVITKSELSKRRGRWAFARHPPCLALPWWMSREDRYTYNWLSLFLL